MNPLVFVTLYLFFLFCVGMICFTIADIIVEWWDQ